MVLAHHKHSSQYYALKIMCICDIIKQKQVEHVRNEKQLLEEVIFSEFIIKLYWTHRDQQHLYMLLEYVPGGDFFTLLKQKGQFKANQAVFYASEIVCALEHLHSKQIVYRDLKPENLMLCRDGHLKLTDFGFAKKLVRDRLYTLVRNFNLRAKQKAIRNLNFFLLLLLLLKFLQPFL